MIKLPWICCFNRAHVRITTCGVKHQQNTRVARFDEGNIFNITRKFNWNSTMYVYLQHTGGYWLWPAHPKTQSEKSCAKIRFDIYREENSYFIRVMTDRWSVRFFLLLSFGWFMFNGVCESIATSFSIFKGINVQKWKKY